MDIKWKDIKTSEPFEEVARRASLHLEGDYRKLGIWVRRVFVIKESTLYTYRTKGDGGSLNGWCIKGADVNAVYRHVDGRQGRNILNISVPSVYRISLSLDSIYEQARTAEALHNGGARIICRRTLMLVKKLTNIDNPPVEHRTQFKFSPKISARLMDVHWTFEELDETDKKHLTGKVSSESDMSHFYSIPKDTSHFSHEHNSGETLEVEGFHSSLPAIETNPSDMLSNHLTANWKSISQPTLNLSHIQSASEPKFFKNKLTYTKSSGEIEQNLSHDIFCQYHNYDMQSNSLVQQEDEISRNSHVIRNQTRANDDCSAEIESSVEQNSTVLYSGYPYVSSNIDDDPIQSYVELVKGKLLVRSLSYSNKPQNIVLNLRDTTISLSKKNAETVILENKKEDILIRMTSSLNEAEIMKTKIDCEIKKNISNDKFARHKQLTRFQHLTRDQIEQRTKELMINLRNTSDYFDNPNQNNDIISIETPHHNTLPIIKTANENNVKKVKFLIQNDNKRINTVNLKGKVETTNNSEKNSVTDQSCSIIYSMPFSKCPQNVTTGNVKMMANKYEQTTFNPKKCSDDNADYNKSYLLNGDISSNKEQQLIFDEHFCPTPHSKSSFECYSEFGAEKDSNTWKTENSFVDKEKKRWLIETIRKQMEKESLLHGINTISMNDKLSVTKLRNKFE